MTEKRFILDSDYDWWYVKDTTGKFKGEYSGWMSDDKVVDLLNTLNDENEQLKSLCITLIKNIEKKSIAFVIDEEIRKLLE